MVDVGSDLADLGAAEVIARFVRAVSAERPVESDRRGSYVSLRPQTVGAIASAQLAGSDYEAQRLMGRLTSLRLLDVLAWSLDKKRAT